MFGFLKRIIKRREWTHLGTVRGITVYTNTEGSETGDSMHVFYNLYESDDGHRKYTSFGNTKKIGSSHHFGCMAAVDAWANGGANFPSGYLLENTQIKDRPKKKDKPKNQNKSTDQANVINFKPKLVVDNPDEPKDPA